MAGVTRLLAVLRHRDFRLLWFAQSSSVIGDSIVTVALALFVIDLTGSATDLGLVLAAHALPLVGFMLIGGVWADRLPRHRVMIVTDLARFTLHALLAVLIIAGELRIWQLVVIEMLFGTAEAFFRPAATGLLPQTVPEAEIQEANAVTTTFNNIAEFIGPALATALVLGVGAGAAFAVDAATLPDQRRVPLAACARGGAGPLRPRRGEQRCGARCGRASRRSALEPGCGPRWSTFCVALFVALAPWASWVPPSRARAVRRHRRLRPGQRGAGRRDDRRLAGRHSAGGRATRCAWRCCSMLLWPAATILFASGVSLFVVMPASSIAGSRHRAVRRVVADRAGRANPAGQAVSGDLL